MINDYPFRLLRSGGDFFVWRAWKAIRKNTVPYDAVKKFEKYAERCYNDCKQRLRQERRGISVIYYHNEQACSVDLTSAICAHSGDLTVSYKTAFGDALFLSYYFPQDHRTADRTFPTIVLIHGGGWRYKKIFPDQNGAWQGDYLGFLGRYLAQKGYVAVSVDYRLVQQAGQKAGYQLVDCLDDCVDAVRYILQNAAVHKIDTGNMFLLGESAGGHLAGMLATRYQMDDFRFKAAFLVNSILNIATDPRRQDRIPVESAHPAIADLSLEERMRYLSPEWAIRADMCPVVLFHGDRDATLDISQSKDFYSAMTQRGLPCQLHIMRNADHAFLLAEYTQQSEICKNAVALLERILQSVYNQR